MQKNLPIKFEEDKNPTHAHTQKKPLQFIVEKKSTEAWRTASKEVRIIVEYKSTKPIFLLYHITNPEFLSNSKGLNNWKRY